MKLYANDALIASQWARDVRIDIATDGTVAAVEVGVRPDGAEIVHGPLLPAISNVHSHAFQRAIAGRTGRAGPESDTFWTWRQQMYAFLDSIDADAFEAIAAQVYVEMLKAGYAAVAEFHYVHRDVDGKPYADPAELARRIAAAAATAEIDLALLPVYYAHSGFAGAPPTRGQRRFVQSLDEYARLVEILERDAARAGFRLGVAPHSLRAVTPDELDAIVALAPHASPIHIHAAEQLAEVEACVAWSGARPIEWLLDHAPVDARWCVVHATHMTDDETRRLAASGAVAGLAPTTEADLGDGTFPARRYLDAGGAFGIGTDSNTIIDPWAELRQLEWAQRLATNTRNVLAGAEVPVGQSLYARASAGGARALARTPGAIAPGARADFVVLEANDPGLAGHDAATLIDAAIFGPCRRPVRDVMVGGRWVVREGRHPHEDAILDRYCGAIARVAR